MMTLIWVMFAKHTFKLAIFQITSSYYATLSPQLLRVIIKLTWEGRVGRNTSADSLQGPGHANKKTWVAKAISFICKDGCSNYSGTLCYTKFLFWLLFRSLRQQHIAVLHNCMADHEMSQWCSLINITRCVHIAYLIIHLSFKQAIGTKPTILHVKCTH